MHQHDIRESIIKPKGERRWGGGEEGEEQDSNSAFLSVCSVQVGGDLGEASSREASRGEAVVS